MTKVSVCMITYNQERYIAKAIESVLMQKTNFDYELVIGEDYSLDKTREICIAYKNKYPNKIKLILAEKNSGTIHNLIQTMKQCSGEYIAMLEGDDYWNDHLKLQKQVDFLDNNPDYGLVHSDFDFFRQRNGKIIKSYFQFFKIKIPTGNIFEDLLCWNFIRTCTSCFRRRLITDSLLYETLIKEKWQMGDTALFLEIANKSKVGYINESLATYRRHKGSISYHSGMWQSYRFTNSGFNLRLYFINKYGCSIKTKNFVYAKYYLKLFIHYFYIKKFDLTKMAYDNLMATNKNFITWKIRIMRISINNFILWLMIRLCLFILKKGPEFESDWGVFDLHKIL
jgi:glycosyltransferase involved in cell wall biosynthesis